MKRQIKKSRMYLQNVHLIRDYYPKYISNSHNSTSKAKYLDKKWQGQE
jgi:hypothetical protein